MSVGNPNQRAVLRSMYGALSPWVQKTASSSLGNMGSASMLQGAYDALNFSSGFGAKMDRGELSVDTYIAQFEGLVSGVTQMLSGDTMTAFLQWWNDQAWGLSTAALKDKGQLAGEVAAVPANVAVAAVSPLGVPILIGIAALIAWKVLL